MVLRKEKEEAARNQKYFRPSSLHALNLRFSDWTFFDEYYDKSYDQIHLPAQLTKTPEDTVINYFSILREAANLAIRYCGSVGNGNIPYPIAYNFLSKAYQKTMDYKAYLNSFAGVGHINLIKLCKIPDGTQGIRYFYEIEKIISLIEPNEEYFGYSYGFIDLIHENGGYRINNMQQEREDFLCAPYHLWQHDAESVIDVKYGDWCKLIKKRYPAVIKGYVKYIFFYGTDNASYFFIFFILTNGTDVEIASFRNGSEGKWKPLKMNPDKDCLIQ